VNINVLLISIFAISLLKTSLVIGQVVPSHLQQEIKTLNAEQAVDFDSNVTAKTSLSQKMVLFEVPKEYECPLFSNSPYVDMLDSLDKMQDQFNNIFPTCENKSLNDRLLQKSVLLRNAVFETKKLMESGQVYKLANRAKTMIESAYQVQQTLSIAARAQTSACYRSPQQFRNVVFSINETFQSISPIVIDIITKNPALASTLGPAVKVLSGADSISNGLSLIEQISKDSVMFDMTDKENRVNTLKNVCQYMKLYRRLEYMRLSRFGKIQTIFSEYQAKINELDENLSSFKKQHNIQSNISTLQNLSSEDPVHEIYVKLKTILPIELSRIQKAQGDIDMAQEEYKNPKISQCQIIKATLGSVTYKRTLEMILDFAKNFGSADEVFSLSEQISAYQQQFDRQQTIDDCVGLGQDILKITLNLVSESQKLILTYDQEIIAINGDKSKLKEKKVELKEKTKTNEEMNFANLKSLLSYASFESSEVEKRAKDMYKYFFSGPDVVKSNCELRSGDQACDWAESIAGWAKAKYQKIRNQGPVYELLLNDRDHFNYAMDAMVKARAVIAATEHQFLLKELGGQIGQGAAAYQTYFRKSLQYQEKLPHMNLKFVKHGSVLHKNLCVSMRQVLDKYLIASTHLLGSQNLCQMIEPVLKEENISSQLKRYCLGSMKNHMTEGEPSEIQKMVYQLVGVRSHKNVKDDLSPESLKIVTFERSPKALVDRLVKIYDDFKCVEN